MKRIRELLDEKGREVRSIEPDASVFAAVEMLAAQNIGALVVMEGGRLVGIISERDYVRKMALLRRD